MVNGAQFGAGKAGKHLFIVNADYEENRDNSNAIERAIDELIKRRVGGVVHATMFHRIVDIPQSLHEAPSVPLGAQAIDGSLPSVVPDDLGGAMEMTLYLLGLGHRLIVDLSTILGPSAVDLRRKGFFAAHEEFGVAPLHNAVIECEATTPAAYEAAMTVLSQDDPPTTFRLSGSTTRNSLHRCFGHRRQRCDFLTSRWVAGPSSVSCRATWNSSMRFYPVLSL